jgi:hypothetical protein
MCSTGASPGLADNIFQPNQAKYKAPIHWMAVNAAG